MENPSEIAAFHRRKAAARPAHDVGDLHVPQTRQSFAAAQAENLEGKTRQESQPSIAVRRQRVHFGMSAICASLPPHTAIPAVFRRCAGRKPRRENPSGIAAFHRRKAAARPARDVGDLHVPQTRQSFAAAQAETLEGKPRQESQPSIAVRRQRVHLGMSAICTSHKPGSLSPLRRLRSTEQKALVRNRSLSSP